MKRYTLRAAIHDAKIFNRLWLEYRQSNRNRRAQSSSGWLPRSLIDLRRSRAREDVALHTTNSADASPVRLFGHLDRPPQGVVVGTMKRNFLTLAAAGVIVIGGFAVVQAQGPRGSGRGHAVEQLTDGLNLTPDQQAK